MTPKEKAIKYLKKCNLKNCGFGTNAKEVREAIDIALKAKAEETSAMISASLKQQAKEHQKEKKEIFDDVWSIVGFITACNREECYKALKRKWCKK